MPTCAFAQPVYDGRSIAPTGATPRTGSVGEQSLATASLDILGDLTADLPQPGTPCIALRMAEERPDLHEQWLRVLPERRHSSRRVADWFTARGFTVSLGQVQHHRSGGCRRCRTTSSPS